MQEHNGNNVPERHERIIENSDLLSENLNKKLQYIRIGAEVPPRDLADENASLTAQLSELKAEKASNGSPAAA